MKKTGTLFEDLRVVLKKVVSPKFAANLSAPVLVPATAGANPFRRVLPALALMAAVAASPAHAWIGDSNDDTWANGRLVDVQIRVDGEAAPLYWSPRNDDRRYVQAFAGRNYSIVLRNNTSRRIGVLLAVDGLNAVNGEQTSLGAGEPMYVLSPYETATIKGWRTSLEQIRRFVFVDERRSYASRTGQANGDMGWIRVVAFREQNLFGWMSPQVRTWGRNRSNYRDGGPTSNAPAEPERGMRDDASKDAPMAQATPEAPAPTAGDLRAPMAKSELQADGMARQQQNSVPGTGWGERRTDVVRQVEFHAERVATDHIVFRYEYESGLRALGIDPDDAYDGRDRVRERDRGQLGFAKPPRW